jgi:hypothetical protein
VIGILDVLHVCFCRYLSHSSNLKCGLGFVLNLDRQLEEHPTDACIAQQKDTPFTKKLIALGSLIAK